MLLKVKTLCDILFEKVFQNRATFMNVFEQYIYILFCGKAIILDRLKPNSSGWRKKGSKVGSKKL